MSTGAEAGSARQAALERTLTVLMDKVVELVDQRGWDLDQVRALMDLEQAVSRRTAELDNQRKQLTAALDDLHATQGQLLQAKKLEAVGQLAAGVAHEINTPVQYIGDSIYFMQDSYTDRTRLYTAVRALLLERAPDLAGKLEALEEEADLEYMTEQVPKALSRAIEGLERVSTIVRSMKTFAHPDSGQPSSVDLAQNITATLELARNEYKLVADVVTELAPLPPVLCYAGELNQVVLNLVVNAGHAIADRVRGTDARGRITVTTRQDGQDVVIGVQDTGTGIRPEIQERIFDPFFTTKEPGKGTGQGLAISRKLVLDKMKGKLWFETRVGEGTTFFLRLSMHGAEGG